MIFGLTNFFIISSFCDVEILHRKNHLPGTGLPDQQTVTKNVLPAQCTCTSLFCLYVARNEQVLYRSAGHRRVRVLYRQQLRTVLHQLLQREATAVLQPADTKGNLTFMRIIVLYIQGILIF